MTVQQNDTYIKACLQAWLFCESCIHSEITSSAPRKTLVRECHDCAQACFAVVCKMVSNQPEIGELVLKCIIHCRQCQAECEQYADIDDIRYCGEVCRYCADKMKDIALYANLN